MESNELKDIKDNCIRRWGQVDEKIKKFEENFDKWCIFSNDEDAKICLGLLDKFNYYSKTYVNKELKNKHEYLLNIFNFDPDYTIYTIVKDEYGRANSSIEYFNEYVHINNINRYSRIEDINNIEDEKYTQIENVVIIDDCIGYSETVQGFLTRYKDRLLGKHIYLILIHLIVDSADILNTFAVDNGFDLTILCTNRMEKPFEENSKFMNKFKEICTERNIPKSKILGRDEVQALMAFYNNTPNNTLGIFWFKTDKNIPLFPRINDEKPGWMRNKKEKEKRKQQNYKNINKEA